MFPFPSETWRIFTNSCLLRLQSKLGHCFTNALSIPTMRLEPINYQEPFVHEDEDDVSSTAAVVNETYDDSDEGKKRSATEDENPGATKKSKSDGEGEQKLPAVPALPNIVLSMRDDANYAQFMKEEFKKMDWVEYNPTIGKVMGNEILQQLQLEYHIVDKNGDSIDDNFALESKHFLSSLQIFMCTTYILYI